MEAAPIALFVYNRPEHTSRTLEALRKTRLADQSVLYVFADGPKSEVDAAQRLRIEKVRRFVRSEQWCQEVHVIEAVKNKGLKRSIVDGVTEVVNRHGRIIVLEDDVVVSNGFLEFSNEALELYKDDQDVMHINGCMYDAEFESEQDTFFLRVLSCQGWATWKRAWKHYNDDALDHLAYFQQSAARSKAFDIGGNAFFMEQLRRNVSGRLDTWAVRWYASWLRAGGLSLFPRKSLLRNIGFDNTGVNCGAGKPYMNPAVLSLEVKRIPVVEDQRIRQQVGEFWVDYLGKPGGGKGGRGPMRESLKRAIEPAIEICGKLIRRVLGRLLPELQPLWNSPRRMLLHDLASKQDYVRVGRHVQIVHPHRLHYCIIGNYSYLSRNSVASYTEIGKHCSIGPNFHCGWGAHPTDGISTSPSFYSMEPPNGVSFCDESRFSERLKVAIGNDVFIGMNVTVLDGVTIGDGAVVGAGCVVSKDVPPYAIVVGCPMRVLRYRFSPEIRQLLQKTAWWDWAEEELEEMARFQFDVDAFVARYGARRDPHATSKNNNN